jgi:hypothetical protein
MPAPDIAIFVDFIIWTYHFSNNEYNPKNKNPQVQKKSGSLVQHSLDTLPLFHTFSLRRQAQTSVISPL